MDRRDEVNIDDLPDLDQFSDELNTNNSLLGKLNQSITKMVSSLGLTGAVKFMNGGERDPEDELMMRSLSSIQSSLDTSTMLSNDDRTDMSARIDKLINQFNDSGEVDYLSYSQLLDKVDNSLDQLDIDVENFNKIVKVVNGQIDSSLYRDTQSNIIDQLVSHNPNINTNDSINKILSDNGDDKSKSIVSGALNRDSLINNYYNENISQIVDDYDGMKDSLDQLMKAQIDQGKSSNEMIKSLETYLSENEKVFDPEALNKLAKILESIDRNTDPENNELSNAEKILKNNEAETDRQNNELLKKLVNDLSDDKNESVLNKLGESSSAKELGENAVDALWNMGADLLDVGGDSDVAENRKRARSRNRTRSRVRTPGRPRGRFGRLLSFGKQAVGAAGSTAAVSSLASGGGDAVRGASKAASALSTTGKVLGTAGKVAGPLAIATQVGSSAIDYYQADNDKERIDAVSGGGGALAGGIAGGQAGAAIGAGIGAFFGGVGAAPGAVIGGFLGAVGGAIGGSAIGKKIGSWFSDITDTIPDEITKQGPIVELDYIDRIMMPALKADVASDKATYTPADLKDLEDYRKKLVTKTIPDKVKKDLAESGISPKETEKRFNFLTKYYEALKSNNPTAYAEVLATLPTEYDGLAIKEASTLNVSVPKSFTPQYSDNQNLNNSITNLVSDLSGATGSDPSKILNSDLGALSAKYESGGRGVATISSGVGDAGGVSYGTYQLASKTGTMAAFLNSQEGSKYKQAFAGKAPGSSSFNETYKQIVATDAQGFNQAQHNFIKRTHFDPVEQYAKSKGIDTSNRAIREALWSQSVQHGFKGNQQIIDNVVSAGVDLKDPNAVIKAIYTSRNQYARKFASSAATTDRYSREMADALALNNATTEAPSPIMDAANSGAETQLADNSSDQGPITVSGDGKNTNTIPQSQGPDLSNPLSDTEIALVDQRLSQGMTNPGQIALSTNINPERVVSYLKSQGKSSDVMAQAGKDYKVDKIDVGSNKSDQPAQPTTPIIVQQAPPATKSSGDEYRISDNSLLLASMHS